MYWSESVETLLFYLVCACDSILEEKHGKGKRNPKRVGADFHRKLKSNGLLDRDDEDW